MKHFLHTNKVWECVYGSFWPFFQKHICEVRCWTEGLAHSLCSNSSQRCSIGLRSGLFRLELKIIQSTVTKTSHVKTCDFCKFSGWILVSITKINCCSRFVWAVISLQAAMLSIPDLIKKKRDGGQLSDEEIKVFIDAVTNKTMQESQIGTKSPPYSRTHSNWGVSISTVSVFVFQGPC